MPWMPDHEFGLLWVAGIAQVRGGSQGLGSEYPRTGWAAGMERVRWRIVSLQGTIHRDASTV